MKEFEDCLEVKLVKLRKASLSNLLFRLLIYNLPFPLVDGVNINYSAGSVIGGAREIVSNNVSLTFAVYDLYAIVFNRSEKTKHMR